MTSMASIRIVDVAPATILADAPKLRRQVPVHLPIAPHRLTLASARQRVGGNAGDEEDDHRDRSPPRVVEPSPPRSPQNSPDHRDRSPLRDRSPPTHP